MRSAPLMRCRHIDRFGNGRTGPNEGYRQRKTRLGGDVRHAETSKSQKTFVWNGTMCFCVLRILRAAYVCWRCEGIVVLKTAVFSLNNVKRDLHLVSPREVLMCICRHWGIA